MEAASELREGRTSPQHAPVAVARAVRQGRYTDAADAPALRRQKSPNLVSRALKRGLDVGASAIALVVLAPGMAVIAVLVRLSSPGPILYMSPRVGRYGRMFQMPKFRTMKVGTQLCARESLGDDQVTPIGRVLRRIGLDELPQLWCVLRGDMSLIGPRPLIVDDPGANERAKFPVALQVRPGISGLAQVSGRNLVSPRRKARLDALYARGRSLGLDIVLIFKTLGVLISGRGFL